MDISSAQLNYRTQYQWNCPSSDSEFYSLSSPETVSPASSMDFNFSPSFQPCGSARGAHSACPHGLQASKSPLSGEERLFSVQPLRKTRSKDPSRQRKSASEKEKLRMRDLTKALHNLRTYLPPSVAPAGQTLTKIETLRLTIRYISHLSAQLGLSQEALAQRGELDTAGCHTAPAFPGCYQYSSIPAHWVPEPLPGLCQYTSTAAHPVQETGLGSCEFSSMLGSSDREEMLNSSTDSLLQSSHFGDTTQSCQVYSEDFCGQILPQEFWI